MNELVIGSACGLPIIITIFDVFFIQIYHTIDMFLIATLFLTLLANSDAYFITVDAHAEECFFDKVSKGTNMGLTFEVAEGGFLDIDVEVRVLFKSASWHVRVIAPYCCPTVRLKGSLGSAQRYCCTF